jgi:hypothetical protein
MSSLLMSFCGPLRQPECILELVVVAQRCPSLDVQGIKSANLQGFKHEDLVGIAVV